MGNAEVNLQDSRYGFRAASLSCAREFARRAMLENVAKNPYQSALQRKRHVVTKLIPVLHSITTFELNNYSSKLEHLCVLLNFIQVKAHN